MGIPVIIASNGRGFPVRQVESGAPVMTIAENGRGAPIVLSDNGAPFVIQGGGVDLTFAFTFNGEPFTFGDAAFTYGAA